MTRWPPKRVAVNNRFHCIHLRVCGVSDPDEMPWPKDHCLAEYCMPIVFYNKATEFGHKQIRIPCIYY